jgi:hypothetical protein
MIIALDAYPHTAAPENFRNTKNKHFYESVILSNLIHRKIPCDLYQTQSTQHKYRV